MLPATPYIPNEAASMPLQNVTLNSRHHPQRPPIRITAMHSFTLRSKIQLGMRRSTSTSERVTFVRRNGQYHPAKQKKLKNSLLAGVGFLELANAVDFAANVWNTIPVPLFAATLMGIGGAVALALSLFAFQDAVLSRRNILLLQDERRYLKRRRASVSRGTGIEPELAVQLDVSFREIGTEIIDRIGMDSFMGFGAVLVAIGTFMAIGGANPRVYMASNLLSGYIGNTPSAFYGIVNAGWSIYIWRRAHRQATAAARKLKSPDVKILQKKRIHTIKMHATLNGLTGLIAGIAGIITATRWWGYVVLIPCTISAIYCNSVWRRKIGYERPSILQSPSVDHHEMVEEIRLAAVAQRLLKEAPSTAFDNLVPNKESISCVMDFIVMHGFFDDFCVRLLKDSDLTTALFGSSHLELEIDSLSLLTAEKTSILRLLEIAEASIRETGLPKFRDRQRFLLEKLGCQLCLARSRNGDMEINEEKPLEVDPVESLTDTDISVASSAPGGNDALSEEEPPEVGPKAGSTSAPEPAMASDREANIATVEKKPLDIRPTETLTTMDVSLTSS